MNDKADRYYRRLVDAKRYMGEICTSTNISKENMKWLESLETESLDDLPVEMRSETRVNDCLVGMYKELMAGKDEYFINEWTLSKKGRHKMREYIDAMPSIRDVEPPQIEFTNVPYDIDFSNGILEV